jgi:hypothetical protein
MHMVFLYYVIVVGGTILFAVWYMNRFWSQEIFEQIAKEKKQ